MGQCGGSLLHKRKRSGRIDVPASNQVVDECLWPFTTNHSRMMIHELSPCGHANTGQVAVNSSANKPAQATCQNAYSSHSC